VQENPAIGTERLGARPLCIEAFIPNSVNKIGLKFPLSLLLLIFLFAPHFSPPALFLSTFLFFIPLFFTFLPFFPSSFSLLFRVLFF